MNTKVLETIYLHLESQHITDLLIPGNKIKFEKENLMININTYYHFGDANKIRPPSIVFDEDLNNLSIVIDSNDIPQTPMAWLEINAKMINKKIIITCPIRK